jgi:hypothetical protein
MKKKDKALIYWCALTIIVIASIVILAHNLTRSEYKEIEPEFTVKDKTTLLILR